jgi:glyoxylase-like metal-dependent hydrolase (beta-lactamase superfamily II)/rhodanese-related sulfurtransferase
MYIEQLYTNCLAEAAYYIESEGEVAIIDPLRETDPYISMAKERNAEIKYIFETHFHADFVSGHVDLAKKTGAKIVFGPKAETSFDSHIASDGETFKIGKLTLKVLHTPGHTPESSTYLLFDENGKEHCIFSGDTLFIGDVGRPDLAVKSDLTKEDLASLLFDSLHNKIMPLPDSTIVYPAHGAGSACGKNMSSETFDTLGNQKKTNYALSKELSKEDFIEELTSGILPPPQYFPKAVQLNKNGYADIDDILKNAQINLSVDQVKTALAEGAIILDTRGKDDFKAGFIPNSIFIGIDGGFAVWVGTLIENLSQAIVVIADEGREEEVVMRLARVGYDNCLGYLEGGINAWTADGGKLNSVRQLAAEDLSKESHLENHQVLDVRKPSEFESEHVQDATNFPLDFINGHSGDLNKDTHYLVHCKSGYRSVVAISLLMRVGYKQFSDITGGFQAILKTDTPITEFICPNS